MVPLTPARLSRAKQVSLLHESNLPDVPIPTTLCRPRRREFVFHASVQATDRGSRVRHPQVRNWHFGFATT